MKKNILKPLAVSLILVLIPAIFCSCKSEEPINSSKKSEQQLIIMVDGKKITIENTDNKTIEDLLKEAKITLDNGDSLSIDMNVKLTEDIVVNVLRQVDVTIKDLIRDVEYTVVLTGATVEDAIDAVGIKLADDQTVNFELDESLKDGMEIVVSVREEEETTEPHTEEPEDSNNNWNSGYTPPAPVVTNPPATKPVETTKPPVTKAPTTKPAEPTTSGRTIVSVEIYEDCDGSGHGVKVITYSDGTQEEVAF